MTNEQNTSLEAKLQLATKGLNLHLSLDHPNIAQQEGRLLSLQVEGVKSMGDQSDIMVAARLESALREEYGVGLFSKKYDPALELLSAEYTIVKPIYPTRTVTTTSSVGVKKKESYATSGAGSP
jgi:hypothetical protein